MKIKRKITKYLAKCVEMDVVLTLNALRISMTQILWEMSSEKVFYLLKSKRSLRLMLEIYCIIVVNKYDKKDVYK